jgi:LysR family transcriptional regulator, glycine cleavage system transcriptional activator
MSQAECASSLRIDDSALILDAAVAGHGVALARGVLVHDELQSGRLVRLFDHQVRAEYSYWCVWKASSPRGKLLEAFVDWLAAEMAAIASEPPDGPTLEPSPA